jgi:hypothetical protein
MSLQRKTYRKDWRGTLVSCINLLILRHGHFNKSLPKSLKTISRGRFLGGPGYTVSSYSFPLTRYLKWERIRAAWHKSAHHVGMIASDIYRANPDWAKIFICFCFGNTVSRQQCVVKSNMDKSTKFFCCFFLNNSAWCIPRIKKNVISFFGKIFDEEHLFVGK